VARISCPAGEVEAAVAAARRAPTARNVHDLRVTLARARVWLKLAGHPALDAEVRALRQAAQPLRDLDVRLELAPPVEVRKQLAAKRPAARARLARALSGADPLLEALATLEPLARRRGKRGVAKLARRVRSAIDAAEADPGALDAMHALRRRVRNLRYALELLDKSAARELGLQTALGELCDRALALEAGAPGGWRAQLEADAKAAARKARERWRALVPRLEKLD
jgi:CHAD domain-containing protein